jgi:2-haloacid dehalogenase
VVQGFGRRLGFVASEAERRALPESMANWQPFPDTVAALQRLKTRYSLNIISNVDDDLFAASARRLQVQFDQVTTAQQAHSYKPSSNNFLLALQKIGIPREEVLHVGQSIYHDVVPAQELGLATVWVNRRSPCPGAGATKPAEAKPDLEVPDLKTLADLACPSEPLRP